MDQQPVLHPIQPHSVYVRKLVAERVHNLVPERVYHPRLSTSLHMDKDEDGPFSVLTVSVTGDPDEEFPFEIDIHLVAHFRIPKGDSVENEEGFTAFLSQQAVVLLWPYARVYVTETLDKLGLPPISLPWVNVKETAKKISETPDGEA